jgi:hypothetical protein
MGYEGFQALPLAAVVCNSPIDRRIHNWHAKGTIGPVAARCLQGRASMGGRREPPGECLSGPGGEGAYPRPPCLWAREVPRQAHRRSTERPFMSPLGKVAASP